MMRKFETTVKTLGRERDKYKEKSSNDFKSLADQHEEDIKALKDEYEQKMKKMIKEKDDKISRLVVENRSLKDRTANLELEKSENIKRILRDDRERDQDRLD